jgi:hypothetical protein
LSIAYSNKQIKESQSVLLVHLFGKQTKRSAPGTTFTIVCDQSGILRANNLLPGAEVSVDHFTSSVKG